MTFDIYPVTIILYFYVCVSLNLKASILMKISFEELNPFFCLIWTIAFPFLPIIFLIVNLWKLVFDKGEDGED